MKVYDVFKEYIWLVQTIHRHKRLSLKEINELWHETDMSGGNDMNRITFTRHLNAIQDIFGIYIECDRKNGYKYYIGNNHVLEEDSVQNWLLSTLSVNNIISESLSVQDRIQIEAIPDDRFLEEIIEAMKSSHKIEMTYRRFGAESKTHVLCPYALKVYQKRWYLLAYFEARVDEEGKEHKAHYAIFSFDRIERVKTLKDKFKIDKDFNLKDYFADSYGIVNGDDTPTERVVIRAYGREAYDMRSLPLHHSQRELPSLNSELARLSTNWSARAGGAGGGSDYADFELYLKPTLDFTGKLLSRGAWIEVLQPQSLRDQLIEMHRKSLERYSE